MAFDLDDEENEATRKMNGASKERKDENMDIEVGEYVRTKDGKIDKVINSNFYMGIYVECEKGLYLIKSMVKHSKKLIDLIEVGDYVNGYKVIKLKDGFANGTMEIVLSNNTIIYRHHSEDIETILTKESYIANCYKVGGEQVV
jgi:hypothetical protein